MRTAVLLALVLLCSPALAAPAWRASVRAEIARSKAASGSRARQRAELRLARALQRAGLRIAAYTMYAVISHQPRHAGRVAALRALLSYPQRLARALDLPAVVASVDATTARRLGARDAATLRYAQARAAFSSKRFDRALELLAKVRGSRELRARAALLRGFALLRKKRMAAAMRAYREAVRRLRGRGGASARRLRDLALLSQARLHYGAKRYKQAIAAYRRARGERRRVLVEQAWAYLRSGQHRRAYADVRKLAAADDEPEARVIESVLLFKSCRFRRSAQLAQRFVTRFSQVATRLRALAKQGDSGRVIAWAHELRGRAQALARGASALARKQLSRGVVGRNLDLSAAIAAELRRIARAPASWKATALAGRVLQELVLKKSLVDSSAARALRLRLAREARIVRQLVKMARSTLEQAKRGGSAPPGCNKLGKI